MKKSKNPRKTTEGQGFKATASPHASGTELYKACSTGLLAKAEQNAPLYIHGELS